MFLHNQKEIHYFAQKINEFAKKQDLNKKDTSIFSEQKGLKVNKTAIVCACELQLSLFSFDWNRPTLSHHLLLLLLLTLNPRCQTLILLHCCSSHQQGWSHLKLSLPLETMLHRLTHRHCRTLMLLLLRSWSHRSLILLWSLQPETRRSWNHQK